MKLKKSAIGTQIMTKNLGFIKIQERHLPILLREGHYHLVEGMVHPKKLVALEDKTVSELREIAKEMEGYS